MVEWCAVAVLSIAQMCVPIIQNKNKAMKVKYLRAVTGRRSSLMRWRTGTSTPSFLPTPGGGSRNRPKRSYRIALLVETFGIYEFFSKKRPKWHFLADLGASFFFSTRCFAPGSRRPVQVGGCPPPLGRRGSGVHLPLHRTLPTLPGFFQGMPVSIGHCK